MPTLKPDVLERRRLQTLIRRLVEDPKEAAAFLADPVSVARSRGISLEGTDIRALVTAVRDLGRAGADNVTHYDFPECEHIEVSGSKLEEVINPAMRARSFRTR